MPSIDPIEALGQMMNLFQIADALAAVRQGAEEDTALLRFMDSSIATMHARLSNCKRARPSA